MARVTPILHLISLTHQSPHPKSSPPFHLSSLASMDSIPIPLASLSRPPPCLLPSPFKFHPLPSPYNSLFPPFPKLSLRSLFFNNPSPVSAPATKSAGGAGFVSEIDDSDFSDTLLNSDRPVLVEFVANWCGPCRLISPAIEYIAQEYKDRLMVVKIDHDANPRLIEEYKVYGLPTLILFKNGQEIPESRREGAITKAKLKEYIDFLLNSISV